MKKDGWMKANMRKASIMTDCVLSIIQDGTNGKMLVDEDYLLSKGLAMKDLEKHALVPGGNLVYIVMQKMPHRKLFFREDLLKIKSHDMANDEKETMV